MTTTSDVTMAVTAKQTGRKAAKTLLKQSLQACQQSASSSNTSTVLSCAQSLDFNVFSTLEKTTRMALVMRDVKRDMAAERMKACMQSASMNTTTCMTKARMHMQSVSISPVSETQLQDSFLVSRCELLSRCWHS